MDQVPGVDMGKEEKSANWRKENSLSIKAVSKIKEITSLYQFEIKVSELNHKEEGIRVA